LPDRSWASTKLALRRMLRKVVPHHAREYLLFPALAGPFAWKVLAGNWLAARIRDVYSLATIYCGHTGPEITAYPEGTGAHGRGEWYRMQTEASNNFDVPRWVSLLCGGLDKQIEHHMFPRFPTERLREIAPEIRRICEDHGVPYRSDTWGRTLLGVMKKLGTLSFPHEGDRAAARAAAQASAQAAQRPFAAA
jgi:linoleoyl-CoA desaturase